MKNNDAFVWRKRKIIEKLGFKWMVLVLFESKLYIASVMFIENRQKKKILCMTCLAVIMMSICEMCIKLKKKYDKNRKGKKNP